MRKSKFLIPVLILILSACSQNPSSDVTALSEKASSQSSTQAAAPLTPEAMVSGQLPPTQADLAAAQESMFSRKTDFSVPRLIDNFIYCRGEKVGKIKDGRIYMKLYDKVVSFEQAYLHGVGLDPGIKDLYCTYDTSKYPSPYVGFSYSGLEISPRLYSALAVYQTIDTPDENHKITYKCDGSLAKQPNSASKSYSENVPYYYCETNGKDYLTQYEFQGASGYPIWVGLEPEAVAESWVKVYIKKYTDLNYFFMAEINNLSYNYENYYWIPGGTSEKYQQLTQKSYLNDFLNAPHITTSLAIWDNIVKSFRVEPDTTQI